MSEPVVLCARCQRALTNEPDFALAAPSGTLVSVGKLCYHFESLYRLLNVTTLDDTSRSVVATALAEVHLFVHQTIVEQEERHAAESEGEAEAEAQG